MVQRTRPRFLSSISEFLFQWFHVCEIVELLKMGFVVDNWAVDTQPHCLDS